MTTQRRQFQARVEAFGTTQVIGLRDELLTTWDRDLWWRRTRRAA